MKAYLRYKTTYRVRCFGPKAECEEYYRANFQKENLRHMLELKWFERFENTQTDDHKTYLLQTHYKGSGYTAAWYLSLISSTGFTALSTSDTASSHAGWVEDTNYSEANRPALVFADAANKSISTSDVTFTLSDTTTIKGAFVISNNTKGGTTGYIPSMGLFDAEKTGGIGDIILANFTMTVV